jgi:hypothetical protein
MSQVTFNSNVKLDQLDPFEEGKGGPGGASKNDTPPPPGTGGGVDYAKLGIPALAVPSLAVLSLEQLVKAIGVEGRQVVVKQGLDAIRAKGEEIRELNEKKMEEVQKQLENLKKQQKLSPFLKAFKWIGMVLGAIASVGAIVAGALTANPLLIAGGIIGLTMCVNSMISEGTGGKVSISAGVAAIAKKCGASEETAKWIGFAFEMAITIVGIGLTMGGGFASSTSQVASTVIKALIVVTLATTIASGANSVAQGSVQIASAVYDYKIAQAKAELKDLQAILEKIQAAMQSEEDFLEAVMERMENLLGAAKDIIQDNITAQTTILTSGTPNMA